MDKIMKVSTWLKGVFGIMFFLPLVVELVLWIFAQFPERTLFGLPLVNGPIGFAGFSYSGYTITGDIAPSMRLCGFVASLPMMLLQMYWLWQLRQLFNSYAQGKIFTTKATAYIKNTAWAFLAVPFVCVYLDGALSVILTSGNPVGQRIFGVSIGTPQVTDFLTGLVLVVIAWIMNEGARLQEDAELTV